MRINGMTICASDGLPSFDVEVVEGCRLDFDPSRPFEGVLFHLGSNGGGEEWENPHSARMVKVSTVPGLQCGSLAAFVSGPNYHDKGNFTKEQDVGKAPRHTFSKQKSACDAVHESEATRTLMCDTNVQRRTRAA